MPVSLASAPATTHGAVVPIAYSTPTGNSFSFTNIPQTYQDLMVVLYPRDTYAATYTGISMGFNGEFGSGTNYSLTRLRGDGSAADSNRASSQSYIPDIGFMPGASATSGIFGANTFHVLNYANTSTNKTVLCRSASDRNGAGWTILSVGLWRSTAAITSMLFASTTAFASGTTAALYGIRTVGQ